MKPDLIFLPTSRTEGFNSKVVTADDHANSAIIVRELVQNSMDAALETGNGECHIAFNLTDIESHEIPGIESYRHALESAIETHADNLDAAEATIERIEQCFEQDRIPVLNVLDNGIGLNKRRMESLLGDGATDKTGESAERGGSFGVGHFTAFPASDPRYILYGGVTQTGRKCMSGHAILASHKPEKSLPPPFLIL